MLSFILSFLLLVLAFFSTGKVCCEFDNTTDYTLAKNCCLKNEVHCEHHDKSSTDTNQEETCLFCNASSIVFLINQSYTIIQPITHLERFETQHPEGDVVSFVFYSFHPPELS